MKQINSKKWILFLLFTLGFVGGINASSINFNNTSMSGGYAATRNVDYDLNKGEIDGLTVQVVYSSYTEIAVNVLNTDVNVDKDSVTSTNTFCLGLPVLIENVLGTLPTGLVTKTTYYVIPDALSSNIFYLATTSTAAVKNIRLNITAASTTDIFSITPIPISGTFTFKLQGGNDGVNFSDLYIDSSQCSLSVGSPYTASSVMWDFGDTYFKYLRLNFTTGTWGAIDLDVLLNGKRFR